MTPAKAQNSVAASASGTSSCGAPLIPQVASGVVAGGAATPTVNGPKRLAPNGTVNYDKLVIVGSRRLA